MAGEVIKDLRLHFERKDRSEQIRSALDGRRVKANDTPTVAAWRDQVQNQQYIPIREPGGWRSTATKTAVVAGLGAGAVLLAKNVYKDEQTSDFSYKELLKSFAK